MITARYILVASRHPALSQPKIGVIELWYVLPMLNFDFDTYLESLELDLVTSRSEQVVRKSPRHFRPDDAGDNEKSSSSLHSPVQVDEVWRANKP